MTILDVRTYVHRDGCENFFLVLKYGHKDQEQVGVSLERTEEDEVQTYRESTTLGTVSRHSYVSSHTS